MPGARSPRWAAVEADPPDILGHAGRGHVANLAVARMRVCQPAVNLDVDVLALLAIGRMFARYSAIAAPVPELVAAAAREARETRMHEVNAVGLILP